jgi:hypothetical protein
MAVAGAAPGTMCITPHDMDHDKSATGLDGGDAYSRMKNLERQIEFINLQVRAPCAHPQRASVCGGLRANGRRVLLLGKCATVNPGLGVLLRGAGFAVVPLGGCAWHVCRRTTSRTR